MLVAFLSRAVGGDALVGQALQADFKHTIFVGTGSVRRADDFDLRVAHRAPLLHRTGRKEARVFICAVREELVLDLGRLGSQFGRLVNVRLGLQCARVARPVAVWSAVVAEGGSVLGRGRRLILRNG